jgi:hypothetical protein
MLPMYLSSCGNSCSLTVQTDYLTHKDLASYYVNTPDPRQNITAIGQRLIVCWSVPKSYLSYEDLHLEVTIRFRNREEIIEVCHLSRTRGTYVFALLNADYLAKRGILTYKINIVGGGLILEEWRHQIWFDLISINQQDTILQEAAKEEETYPVHWDQEDPLP